MSSASLLGDVLSSESDFLFKNDFLFRSGIRRRESLAVDVGDVKIGGGNPIVVQSMTLGNGTDPNDYKKIAEEEARGVIELAEAGSQIVRVAVNSDNAILAGPIIREKVNKAGFEHVPLVACGQYEIARGISKYPKEMAEGYQKVRVNPGNIGFGDRYDENFTKVIEFACKHDMPVRIGVNWGSLDKHVANKFMDDNSRSADPQPSEVVLRKALVASALISAKKAEEIGLPSDKIVISCKVSKVQDLLCIYRVLAHKCRYALHLGLTEAGVGMKSVVSTAAGLSILMQEGIGDTIRASLTPVPGQKRAEEVILCQQVLQSMGIRSFAPQTTSCPGCGRTNSGYFRELASEVDSFLKERKILWKNQGKKGFEDMQVAVMGCIVNGPGESKHANIGISLPGYGESPSAVVFIDKKRFATLKGNNVSSEFKQIIDNYVEANY